LLVPSTTIITRTAAPLRQQVVKAIREDILDGGLVPGQRLVESVLCDAYGVSRTVIREALRQLESEHLIRVMPNLGPIVTVLTESEIKSIYVVRASLEGLAGELFALHATFAESTAKATSTSGRSTRRNSIGSCSRAAATKSWRNISAVSMPGSRSSAASPSWMKPA
jgi:DNA-binding transcriptional regulator YhcF (GntR family)